MLNENEVYVFNGKIYCKVNYKTDIAFVNINQNFKANWTFGKISKFENNTITFVDSNGESYNIFQPYFENSNRIQYLQDIPISFTVNENNKRINLNINRPFAFKVFSDLLKSKKIYDVAVWNLLPACVKIRTVIYVSNYKKAVEKYNKEFTALSQYEQIAGNKLVGALFEFLLTINETDMHIKQRRIKNAHEMLVDTITQTYGKLIDITPEIVSFVPLCQTTFDCSICQAYISNDNQVLTCPLSYGEQCQGLLSNKKPSNYSELTDQHIEKTNNQFCDQDIRNLLRQCSISNDEFSIIRAKGLETIEEYPYRIAAYIARLSEQYPYLKCRECGEVMLPDYEYTKHSERYALTVFSCRNQDNKHDHFVYINHCFYYKKHNSFWGMHSTIDSRECTKTENDALHQTSSFNAYLCMYCGGGIYRVKPKTFCPKCLERSDQQRNTSFKCPICGHDGSNYGQFPSWNSKPGVFNYSGNIVVNANYHSELRKGKFLPY